MNIYTKTGDKGTTSLFGGSRVNKCDLKVEAYGTIDELISFIGVSRAEVPGEEEKNILFNMQKELFMLGAELASDEKGLEWLKEKIESSHIEKLEKIIDKYMEITGPLTAFVIPGANKSSASLHVARTVARRGERIMASLNEMDPLREEIKKYINRLSDALFALARYEEAEK
ncbi:cob(I)yrinic acid a,c-diamide adenosyltransferase [Clostridium sp. B9]|uniref:cob(I)yrinic acid a,c-diamide adenosyltransferase n=1 Tax=Clostridium sp. B9 TaxID=3423224 RepID=UPI003D2E9D14